MKEEGLTRKVAKYRRFCIGFFVVGIVLLAVTFYNIFQYHHEIVTRMEMEYLYTHYYQQWVNTVIERNEYQTLYEDCRNQVDSLPWSGYSSK